MCPAVVANGDDSAKSPQPKRCGHVLAGKFVTNLKFHRKRSVYQDVLAKE